jgi:hypothetical protein
MVFWVSYPLEFQYPSTLANSTLINYIIFKNVEIFKNYFFQSKSIVKDNIEYLRTFHLLKWFFQNCLIIRWAGVEMAKVLR